MSTADIHAVDAMKDGSIGRLETGRCLSARAVLRWVMKALMTESRVCRW